MRISDWSSDVCSSDLLHRLRPVARDQNLIVLIGPAQLALQTHIVLNDQQLGWRFRAVVAHQAALSVFLWMFGVAVTATGRIKVKRLPSPSRLSTPIRPFIAAARARASNAPMPKPPSLLQTKTLKSWLRMNSALMPQPRSITSTETCIPC